MVLIPFICISCITTPVAQTYTAWRHLLYLENPQKWFPGGSTCTQTWEPQTSCNMPSSRVQWSAFGHRWEHLNPTARRKKAICFLSQTISFLLGLHIWFNLFMCPLPTQPALAQVFAESQRERQKSNNEIPNNEFLKQNANHKDDTFTSQGNGLQ